MDVSEGCACRTWEWERHSVSLYVWVSELCLWAEPLQTMNFNVYISSCSWVWPWKLCCATDSLPAGPWYNDSEPALLASPAPVCTVQHHALFWSIFGNSFQRCWNCKIRQLSFKCGINCWYLLTQWKPGISIDWCRKEESRETRKQKSFLRSLLLSLH